MGQEQEKSFSERVMRSWEVNMAGWTQLHEAMHAGVSYRLKMPLSLTDGARLCLAVIGKEGQVQWSLELPMALDRSTDNAIADLTFDYDVSSLRPCKPAAAGGSDPY